MLYSLEFCFQFDELRVESLRVFDDADVREALHLHPFPQELI